MATQSVQIHELVKGDLVKIHGQHAIVKHLGAVEDGWELTLLIGSGTVTPPVSQIEAAQDIPLLRHV